MVKNDATLGLSTEAVDILIERMKLHFGLEERSAAKLDMESHDILREDHAELLKLLIQVKESMRQRNGAEAQIRLQAFIAALAKHDQEVDIPLFRMMAAAARAS